MVGEIEVTVGVGVGVPPPPPEPAPEAPPHPIETRQTNKANAASRTRGILMIGVRLPVVASIVSSYPVFR